MPNTSLGDTQIVNSSLNVRPEIASQSQVKTDHANDGDRLTSNSQGRMWSSTRISNPYSSRNGYKNQVQNLTQNWGGSSDVYS